MGPILFLTLMNDQVKSVYNLPCHFAGHAKETVVNIEDDIEAVKPWPLNWYIPLSLGRHQRLKSGGKHAGMKWMIV